MRKGVWVFGVIALMTTSCALFHQNKEEKFVNLLFYNPLIPISSIARETYLSPNSLKFSNSPFYKKDDNHKEGWTTQSCVLLENKQDFVILKCRFYNPVIQKQQTNINKFQISECLNSSYCSEYRWLVELIEYDNNSFRRSGEIYGIK